MIYILTHATKLNDYDYETIAKTLVDSIVSKYPYTLIKHYFNSYDTSYDREDGVTSYIKIGGKSQLVRYFWQGLANMKYTWRAQSGDVIIAINPLNYIFLLGWRVIKPRTKIVYFSSDYSKKRFNNKILDSIYLLIDYISARTASQVWSVSSRIQQIHAKQGVPKSKNFLVPNVPSISLPKTIRTLKEDGVVKLVTIGILSDQLDFDTVFQLLKSNKKLEFHIIGDGVKMSDLKKQAEAMNISKRVFLYGSKSHKDALNIIDSCDIGLALYNGNWSFNYYGDSVKCREFMWLGLPVITTDTHSTVYDILQNKCGDVITEKNPLDNAINNVLERYPLYSKNCLNLSNKYKNIHIKKVESLI